MKVGAFLLASVVLLAACSTSKSLAHVRAADPQEGITLVVHGDLAAFGRDVPELLRGLGYQDIAVEPREQGTLQVFAAKPARWQGFGLGVRIIAQPASAGLVLRVSFARSIETEGSEDLEASRDVLVKMLRDHFGVVS